MSMEWRSREGTLAAAGTTLVVAMRLAMGMQAQSCGTPDACSYLGLAQTLDRGEGFHSRILFDLQVDKIYFPTHGIEYWRPGTSFFLLLGKLAGGVTLHSSIAITVLAGVVMAAAAWTIAINSTGSRRIALWSYALCLVMPPLWTSSLTPDSTLFYGMAVAWFLALLTVNRQSVAADVGALLLAGLAYMVRNDAVLLAAPLAVVLWRRRASPAYALMMASGFIAALAPVHWLNWRVLGTAFPPGVGKVIFLSDLSDFVLYRQPVSAHTLLAAGVPHLLQVRLATAVLVVWRNISVSVGFATLFLLALWARPRSTDAEENLPELTAGVTFLATMFAFYILLLPAIGIFSALRSFVPMLPLLAVIIVVAIARLSRDRRAAGAIMAGVILVYAAGGFMDDRRILSGLAEQARLLKVVSNGLEASGAQRASAIVMIADPAQFAVQSGFATVAMPKNGDDAIAGLAREVQATHLVINADQMGDHVTTIASLLSAQRTVKIQSSPLVVMVLPRP